MGPSLRAVGPGSEGLILMGFSDIRGLLGGGCGNTLERREWQDRERQKEWVH